MGRDGSGRGFVLLRTIQSVLLEFCFVASCLARTLSAYFTGAGALLGDFGAARFDLLGGRVVLMEVVHRPPAIRVRFPRADPHEGLGQLLGVGLAGEHAQHLGLDAPIGEVAVAVHERAHVEVRRVLARLDHLGMIEDPIVETCPRHGSTARSIGAVSLASVAAALAGTDLPE